MTERLSLSPEQSVGAERVPHLRGLMRQGDGDGEFVAPADAQETRARLTRALTARLRERAADGVCDREVTGMCTPDRAGPSDAESPQGGIGDTASLHALITEMSSRCRDELLLVLPSGARPCAFPAARTAALDLLDRGVRARLIYQHAIRGDLVTKSLVRELTQRGAEVRTCAELIDPLVAYDGEILVLPHSPASSPGTGMTAATVVRNPAMVSFACAAFENLWNSATPLIPDTKDTACNIDDLKKSIVRLMAMGHKDEMVARRLGISVRTCRRHIAEIMDELNATSRFQAGVHLTRAGLVDGPFPAPGPEPGPRGSCLMSGS
ncbi:LuxR C-terminal-related transcriptional regulator [Streptomyces sp. NPDC051020]|uniref:helix-turn-helix transcriptional regulator n=1 Tax=Streptomyces sp. NPDC051020 TaxID=3155409 RepID=UPI0034229ACC